MHTPILTLVALACTAAAMVWGRSARYLRKVELRVEAELGPDNDATILARAQFRKELHTTVLYLVLAGASLIVGVSGRTPVVALYTFILIPVALTLFYGRDFVRESRLFEDRAKLERRAEEVLSQEQLAPRRWSERLAPDNLPHIPGLELGRIYQPGTGMMAGDFYDVYHVAHDRVAVVIGDVTGHGIEPSITAFQAKYLLRVFLREYRDPGQAIEELNEQMSVHARSEEFISLLVAVFDLEASTVRFASAGHPAGWLWHDREVQPLRATGPLLLLDPGATYYSREIAMDEGDVVLTYTDGLAEARDGEHLFGEERIAELLARDPGAEPNVLCKSILDAARDFASRPLSDDVAILAIRRA